MGFMDKLKNIFKKKDKADKPAAEKAAKPAKAAAAAPAAASRVECLPGSRHRISACSVTISVPAQPRDH